MENIDLVSIFAAVTVISGAILAIVKAVVKLTPSKKDDEVVDKIDAVLGPVVSKLGDAESNKPSKP